MNSPLLKLLALLFCAAVFGIVNITNADAQTNGASTPGTNGFFRNPETNGVPTGSGTGANVGAGSTP